MGELMTWSKAPESIAAEGTKTYYIGDKLDLSDLVVTMTMADGTSRALRREEFNVSPLVFTEADQDVVVTYCWDTDEDPLTATATGITVNEREVSSIAIKYPANRIDYVVNDTFDATGIGITVVYSDGSSVTLGEGFEVSDPDMSSAGTEEVTVTYEGETASFEITIDDIVMAAIVIVTPPERLTYTWGDEVDTTGLEVEARFSDGHAEDITASCTSAFNNGSTASQETTSIVVTYDTFEVSIPVTVAAAGKVETPVLSLENDTLSITTDDTATEEYDIYVDNTFVETISATNEGEE